jgi:hypothetical protein
MILPKLIRKIAGPSIFHENFSLSIIGDKIALKIIVKHEVEPIKMMLPRSRAVPLKTCPITKKNKPSQIYHCLNLERPLDS